MGSYVYKVTKAYVMLENGERASVAVFAYKPYTRDNGNQHNKSGAAACDRYASLRHEWVVMGHKVEGKDRIEVESGALALRIGRRGSFTDGWFDTMADRPEIEQSRVKPMSPGRKTRVITTDEVVLSRSGNVSHINAVTFYFDRSGTKHHLRTRAFKRQTYGQDHSFSQARA